MNRKPYPSDLTNSQWKLVAPLIPPVKPGGRPRKYDMREVLNGILYINSEGCRWRALPHDLPHWTNSTPDRARDHPGPRCLHRGPGSFSSEFHAQTEGAGTCPGRPTPVS